MAQKIITTCDGCGRDLSGDLTPLILMLLWTARDPTLQTGDPNCFCDLNCLQSWLNAKLGKERARQGEKNQWVRQYFACAS